VLAHRHVFTIAASGLVITGHEYFMRGPWCAPPAHWAARRGRLVPRSCRSASLGGRRHGFPARAGHHPRV
jgi:hypothetical protein